MISSSKLVGTYSVPLTFNSDVSYTPLYKSVTSMIFNLSPNKLKGEVAFFVVPSIFCY